jgi:2-polyprenyl-6-methoxyphenol hydroxylase-like FAD-dependent oxidoreductase
VRMRPGYSGPWGWARRWRASPVYPEGRDYRAWDTGERVFWTPLGERAEAHFGAPYYQVHRADLLDILVHALGDTSIHLNARVQRFEQDGHGLTMTVADGQDLSQATSWSARTASTPPCEPSYLGRSSRATPAASPGAGSFRPSV